VFKTLCSSLLKKKNKYLKNRI